MSPSKIYIFDSSSFMIMQRYYPLQIMPSLWDKITDLTEIGVIASSQEVFDEINLGDDDLVQWAKERDGCFRITNKNVQLEVRKILVEYPGLFDSRKQKSGADPFVVALAKILNCPVVTQEVKSSNPNKPKIPDVCEKFNIKWTNFVQFMIENNIRI